MGSSQSICAGMSAERKADLPQKTGRWTETAGLPAGTGRHLQLEGSTEKVINLTANSAVDLFSKYRNELPKWMGEIDIMFPVPKTCWPFSDAPPAPLSIDNWANVIFYEPCIELCVKIFVRRKQDE
jgi:hypothetical protein